MPLTALEFRVVDGGQPQGSRKAAGACPAYKLVGVDPPPPLLFVRDSHCGTLLPALA